MKKIDIKDLPSNATAYQLDDGRIYRIHMTLITPVSQLATADYVEVETNGYQIDKSGAFMVDENQEPIMLPKQRARIPLANVRAGTDSVKPGWQVQQPSSGDTFTEEELKGARKLKKLPATAEQGDRVLVDDELYAYGQGLYESVRMGRLSQITQEPAAPSPLDQAAIDDLIP